jgi:hypothetical protein
MRGRRAFLSAVFIVARFAGPLAASQEGADMRMVDAAIRMSANACLSATRRR